MTWWQLTEHLAGAIMTAAALVYYLRVWRLYHIPGSEMILLTGILLAAHKLFGVVEDYLPEEAIWEKIDEGIFPVLIAVSFLAGAHRLASGLLKRGVRRDEIESRLKELEALHDRGHHD